MAKTVIAVGTQAVSFALELEKISNHNFLLINNENTISRKDFYSMPSAQSVEKYDESFPRALAQRLNKSNKDILYVVSGVDLVSSASLVILEHLTSKGRSIDILYIKVPLDFLPEKNRIHERMVRNILQEYTRSALFNKMCLVDFEVVESMCEDLTILNRSEQVNFRIAYCYQSIEEYKKIDPITSSFCEVEETSRIFTIGYSPLLAEEKNFFFPLKASKEVLYYFAINEKKLSSEKNLFRKLTNSIKNNSPDTKTMFAIYETDYDDDYVFFECYTSHVQNENLQRLLLQKEE